MNAQELFHKDGRPTGVWFCEKCRIPSTREVAEQCCKNYTCKRCGADTGARYFLFCTKCSKAHDAEKERERFEKAEKVTHWSGWIYSDAYPINDGYCASVDEFIDAFVEDGYEIPAYAWACDEDHFALGSVDDIIEPICDRAYEDFDPGDLNGVAELKAAIEKFNEANERHIAYAPNYKKAVLIPRPDAA